jgi:hypothetical protein
VERRDACSGDSQRSLFLSGAHQSSHSRSQRWMAHEVWTLDMRRRECCHGVFVRRTALACALFVNPDILMLDEVRRLVIAALSHWCRFPLSQPTNHLDFPAMLWLQDYLKNYPKTLVSFCGACR